MINTKAPSSIHEHEQANEFRAILDRHLSAINEVNIPQLIDELYKLIIHEPNIDFDAQLALLRHTLQEAQGIFPQIGETIIVKINRKYTKSILAQAERNTAAFGQLKGEVDDFLAGAEQFMQEADPFRTCRSGEPTDEFDQ